MVLLILCLFWFCPNVSENLFPLFLVGEEEQSGAFLVGLYRVLWVCQDDLRVFLGGDVLSISLKRFSISLTHPILFHCLIKRDGF